MKARAMFSRVVAAGLTVTLIPIGCGGAQEQSMVEQPRETSAMSASPSQRDEVELTDATRKQIKACMNRRAGQWSERSYAFQFDAKANDHGDMVEVKLRDTTLHDDEVVGCLKQAIATMTVPESALHLRSSKPFSGGERMKREQRGPIGSDSENPLVLLGPFIVEAVGTEVLIQVWLGMVVAVGALVSPKKKPPESDCLDNYVACMDSRLGNLVVDKRGYSLCLTCKDICEKDGTWPWGVELTGRWQTCMY